MPRISPDDHDVIVWMLDEAAAPFVNASTSPNSKGSAADLVTVQGVVAPHCMGPFGPASRALGLITYLTASHYATDVPAVASGTWDFVATASGSGTDVAAPMSVSGWVRFNTHATDSPTTSFPIVKRYAPSGWSSPYTAVEFKVTDGSGTIRLAVTTPTGTRNQVSGSTTEAPVPLGVWCHLGVTFDGYVLRGYLNGELVASLTVASGSPVAIDYGTHGPWAIGAPPGGAERTEPACLLADWRVADVARSAAYFAQIYRAGIIV